MQMFFHTLFAKRDTIKDWYLVVNSLVSLLRVVDLITTAGLL